MVTVTVTPLSIVRSKKALMDFSPYDKRCRGEGASADDLWKCQQKSVETHAALLEGLYAGQVARWRRVFDRTQVLRRPG